MDKSFSANGKWVTGVGAQSVAHFNHVGVVNCREKLFAIWCGSGPHKTNTPVTTVQREDTFCATQAQPIHFSGVILGAHCDVEQGRHNVLESLSWRIHPDHSENLVALILRKISCRACSIVQV